MFMAHGARPPIALARVFQQEESAHEASMKAMVSRF